MSTERQRKGGKTRAKQMKKQFRYFMPGEKMKKQESVEEFLDWKESKNNDRLRRGAL